MFKIVSILNVPVCNSYVHPFDWAAIVALHPKTQARQNANAIGHDVPRFPERICPAFPSCFVFKTLFCCIQAVVTRLYSTGPFSLFTVPAAPAPKTGTSMCSEGHCSENKRSVPEIPCNKLPHETQTGQPQSNICHTLSLFLSDSRARSVAARMDANATTCLLGYSGAHLCAGSCECESDPIEEIWGQFVLGQGMLCLAT